MEQEEETLKMDPVKKKMVLKQRAALFSKPLDKETGQGTQLQGLLFMLTDEQYIIDATFVVEVIPLKELTPLPCSPSFILGIINVRGKVLSVINMKTFLGLSEKGLTNLNRVIIIKRSNIEMGILVDEIIGNVIVYPDHLQPVMPTITGARREYLTGITENRSLVFNIEKFLSGSAIIVDEEV